METETERLQGRTRERVSQTMSWDAHVRPTVRAAGGDIGAEEEQGSIGSCEGSALPVIMSITGPRETHDYRDYNLWVPGTT